MSVCECGKRRYLTRREAKQRAQAFEGPRQGKIRVYCCPAGFFWHLTSASADETTFLKNRQAEGQPPLAT